MAATPVQGWIRSTYCEASTCLEASLVDPGVVFVRDSKHLDQPCLTFKVPEWHSFLDAIAADEYRFE
jgi:hypothetical protein